MNKLIKYEIISLIIVSILGVFFHFTYDLSGQNYFVGLISATNESTWEHLKLLFFPVIFVSIFEYFALAYKNTNYFLKAKCCGILWGMTSIVVFFYTYNGVLGYNVDFLNILSYFIGVFVTYFISCKILIKGSGTQDLEHGYRYFLILILLTTAFILFTYYPPDLGIFISPV